MWYQCCWCCQTQNWRLLYHLKYCHGH